MTSTVPVPAGEVAVIEVAELTVTAVPALAPKRHGGAGREAGAR